MLEDRLLCDEAKPRDNQAPAVDSQRRTYWQTVPFVGPVTEGRQLQICTENERIFRDTSQFCRMPILRTLQAMSCCLEYLQKPVQRIKSWQLVLL